jgi:hypothetical protein
MPEKTFSVQFRAKGYRNVVRKMNRVSRAAEGAGDDVEDAGQSGAVALEAASESADNLKGSLRDVDRASPTIDVDTDGVAKAAAQLKGLKKGISDLDGSTAGVDVSGGRSGRRGDIAGLFGEVGEAASVFARMNAKAQLAIGAVAGITTVATGFQAAALGATAAATRLATEFGNAGIRREFGELKAAARNTARVFSNEFEPIIRSEVLPAARGLLETIRVTSGSLADFSAGTFDTVVAQLSRKVVTVVGTFAILNEGVERAGEALLSLANYIPGVDTRPEPSFGAQESVQLDGPSSAARQGKRQQVRRETLKPVQRQIRAIREQFKEGLIPKEEALQQIRDLRKGLDEELRVLRQKNPALFPDSFITKNLKQLRGVMQRLKAVQSEVVQTSQAIDTIPEVRGLEGFGRSTFRTRADAAERRLQGDIRQTSVQGIPGEMEKTRRSIRRTQQAATTFTQSFTEGISRVLGGVLGLNRGIAGATSLMGRMKSVFVDALSSIIQKLTQAALKALDFGKALGSAGGSGGSSGGGGTGLGQLFGAKGFGIGLAAASLVPVVRAIAGGPLEENPQAYNIGSLLGLADGGIVTSPTVAMIGEGREREAVMPLSKLQGMIDRGGQTVNVTVQGETRTRGGDIYTAYNTTTRKRRRKGHSRR